MKVKIIANIPRPEHLPDGSIEDMIGQVFEGFDIEAKEGRISIHSPKHDGPIVLHHGEWEPYFGENKKQYL